MRLSFEGNKEKGGKNGKKAKTLRREKSSPEKKAPIHGAVKSPPYRTRG